MEPCRKSARSSPLQSKLPYISGNALSAVLKVLQEEGVPKAISRRTLGRQRDKFCMVSTPYGQLHRKFVLDTHAGTQVEVELQHPWAMLYHTAKSSERLSNMLKTFAASASPTNPLQIIIYGDEIMPGNALAITQGRNVWAFYWSCVQFGSAALSDEECI